MSNDHRISVQRENSKVILRMGDCPPASLPWDAAIELGEALKIQGGRARESATATTKGTDGNGQQQLGTEVEVVPDPAAGRKIWWLASYPKSGSTWVRMFVNAYISGFPVDLNSAWQYVSGDLMPHMTQITSALPLGEMGDLEQFYCRPAVLMNFLAMSATRDVCLKTHHAKIDVDGIPLMPPRITKGAVYLIRDPRDVAISFADHLGMDLDEMIDGMANNGYMLESKKELHHMLTSWSSHVDSWTVANHDIRTGVIKYEEMLADPDTAFKGILATLGIKEVDEERFQFAKEQTTFENLKGLEEEGGFRELGQGEKFFREGRTGQWKSVLTDEQIAKIEGNHGATMERFGYEVRKPVLQEA